MSFQLVKVWAARKARSRDGAPDLLTISHWKRWADELRSRIDSGYLLLVPFQQLCSFQDVGELRALAGRSEPANMTDVPCT